MFISGIDPWPWALVLKPSNYVVGNRMSQGDLSGNLRHITGGRLVL